VFTPALLGGLLLAPLFWAAVWMSGLAFPFASRPAAWLTVASVVFWYPLVEELAFRGFLQGRVRALRAGTRQLGGLTLANWATSVAFVFWHAAFNPSLSVLGVGVPSLIFGHFRDRQGSVYPAILLHAAYNASFLLAAYLMNGQG
jgi:membrane protease YdiL (CAAX protease family)